MTKGGPASLHHIPARLKDTCNIDVYVHRIIQEAMTVDSERDAKVIQFRRPYVWYSHPVDCLFCHKSWLMDIDTTMSAVCCPYCGDTMDIDWE